MNNLFDYLDWRGDIPFSQVPLTAVDSLVLSALAYVPFQAALRPESADCLPLKEAAEKILSERDGLFFFHDPRDKKLLEILKESPRFRDLLLSDYVDRLDPESQKQFAALSVHLSDTEIYAAYRGTDYTLVGWKEDFNMAFLPVIPAQMDAMAYGTKLMEKYAASFYFGGHSKGGNLAVFAAACSKKEHQSRILRVFNHDGPGFKEEMLSYPGYQAILEKLETYVPQSSVVGMLLGHEEEYRVVHSYAPGYLQHDPYSWEVKGGGFSMAETVTKNSKRVDRTMKDWLGRMDRQEREAFVDGLYLLLSKDAREGEKLSLSLLRKTDPESRKAALRAFASLFLAVKDNLWEKEETEQPAKETEALPAQKGL